MNRTQLIALGTSLVVAGGISVSAVHSSPDAQRPADEVTQPKAVPTPTAHAPSPTKTATPKPKPTLTHQTAARSLYPLPAPPAYPSPCPPPPIKPGPPPPPPPKPAVPTAKLPKPLALKPHHPSLQAVTGKGMWLTTWADTKLDIAQVIARATQAHLTQLWVRTGGTKQGNYSHHALDALLPAAHRAGLKVIAWDFPALSDPVKDSNRAINTITHAYGGQHIDGFSPDIETINEGTFNAPPRIRVYLSRVRAAATKANIPLIATVMRPTTYQLETYPYAAEAPYIDVFAPMIYWSCSEPGAVTQQSIERLAKLRPVHVIGQSYDMADEGGRHGLPTGREIWRFLDVAKRAGAVGASLYLYSETRRPQWTALGAYPWTR